MALDQATRDRLEQLIHSQRVVLFMKGSKSFPQCGFSSTVVSILTKLGVTFEAVNVLTDPAVREGIKEYSSWPTIPQLYVDKAFVGGSDIVRAMFESGELQRLLGVEGASAGQPAQPAQAAQPARASAPKVTVTAAAAKALGEAFEGGEDVLHLGIDEAFENDLFFGPREPGDVEVKAGGVTIYLDAESARRADGVSIDFVTGPRGAGFKIDNPKAPARVKGLTPAEAKAMVDAGELRLYDVRPDAERALASIAQAVKLDAESQAALLALPKETPIAFHCHHGGRSQRAAEQLVREGFRNVYNVEGGIEAWSLTVDPSVPRY